MITIAKMIPQKKKKKNCARHFIVTFSGTS